VFIKPIKHFKKAGDFMKTIAILGGSQQQTFQKIGKKHGFKKIICHSGKETPSIKKDIRHMAKKADCLVVLLGACSHEAMHLAKQFCKQQETDIYFSKGFGATGAFQTITEHGHIA
jgi:hypothetical protein